MVEAQVVEGQVNDIWQKVRNIAYAVAGAVLSILVILGVVNEDEAILWTDYINNGLAIVGFFVAWLYSRPKKVTVVQH